MYNNQTNLFPSHGGREVVSDIQQQKFHCIDTFAEIITNVNS